MKENIKEISEVPRPSSAPEIEFETEANLVTVTFFCAFLPDCVLDVLFVANGRVGCGSLLFALFLVL